MKRSAGLVAVFLALGSCATTPALADPRIQVSPYYASYALKGRTTMQSLSGGTPVDNQTLDLQQFGQGKQDSDVGIRVDIGDGISGLRADYFRLDSVSSRRGVLGDDWGTVGQGETAGMIARMDELRVSFAYEVLHQKVDLRSSRSFDIRIAPAVMVALHDTKLTGANDAKTHVTVQKVDDKGVLYPALRTRISYHDFAFDAEYAWSPGWAIGGDFEGTQQDLELRLSWHVPTNDVGVFAGWRRANLGMEGNSGGMHFQDDLVLDGFQVGITINF